MREDKRNNSVPKSILRVELVQKKSIMYYQQHSSQPFLKIVVAMPTRVASCRGNIITLYTITVPYGLSRVSFCLFDYLLLLPNPSCNHGRNS